MKLENIFDNIACCVCISDLETHDIAYVSPYLKKRFGVEHDMLGKKCYRMLGLGAPCSFCLGQKLKECGRGAVNVAVPHIDSKGSLHSYHYVEGGRSYCLDVFLEDVETQNSDPIFITFDSQNHIVDCIHGLLEATDLDDAISTLLKTIISYYDGSRGYIFEFDWENKCSNNTYEVCRDETVTPEIANLQNVPLEAMTFWLEAFKNGSIITIENLENIKETRRMEYDILHAQGIKGLIAVPFYEGSTLKGFLGVDDPAKNSSDSYFLENLTYFISTEIQSQRLKTELEKLSYEDALTQLKNRNSYNRYIKSLSGQRIKNAGVCFIDINSLKQMNDTYGHDYGDIVIKYVAQIINSHFEGCNTFRISGDEFVVICEDVDYACFANHVKQLEEALSEDDKKIISCGFVWEENIVKMQDVIKKADDLMYIHKRDYHKRRGDTYSNKSEILQKLLKSLLDKEYMIYLQPKIDLATETVTGAEVLVRYKNAGGQVVSPGEFIPLLEKERLISYIDYFVLKETCALLKRWKEEGRRKISLSLNFSKITLFEQDFVDKAVQICADYGIAYSDLELEVTETQETYDQHQMHELLGRLTEKGFKISLDDFGVGYSSYEFLTQCRFDVVKLDRGLICRITSNETSRIIVKSVVDLCRSLNCRSIAEGVEEKAEYDMLRTLGCDSIQGYYINRPIAVESFEGLYMQNK